MMRHTHVRLAAAFAFATALLVSALVLPSTPALAADATEGSLIFATPEAQAVPMPAPGGSVVLKSTVSNVSDASLQVRAALELDAHDPLASTDSPLTIAFSIDGESVGDAVPLAEAVDAPLIIEKLAPRANAEVDATISMSRDAGNEWAGRSTEAVLHYTAQGTGAPETKLPVPDGALALTGTVGVALLIIVGALILALAVALLWRGARREHPIHAGSSVLSTEDHDEEKR